MNILMTSDTYLPRLGGGEYHVHYMARELRKLGHNVTLMVTEFDAWPGDHQHQVHRRRYRGYASIFPIFILLWRLSRKADLIHGHYSYRLSWLAATVAYVRRIPFIVTQHGLGLLPQPGATPMQRIVFRLWRWWSMHVAGRVISTSDDLSMDIAALGFQSKIVHIPNGYDDDIFHPFPPTPSIKPTILAVRRFTPKNGIQYLIAALPAILKKFPDTRCVLIGDGPMKEQLCEFATSLQVNDHISFLGSLDHKQIVEHYKQADVVVIPSTAESTSLACIEAMAQQKSIVASRVGGLIELLGASEERGTLVRLTNDEHCNYNAPFLIPPDRIQHLSDGIIHALQNPEEGAQKAEKAAQYVKERYTWSIIARRTVHEVYALYFPLSVDLL